MGCVFCEIIKGNIPSMKVYENDDVLAILSIRPITKGHTVVILKDHKETLLDVDYEQAAKLIQTVKKIAPAVMRGTKSTAFLVSMNNYQDSGQEVAHAHMHIIPRKKSDGLKSWKEGEYGRDEIVKYRDSIVKELNK